MFQDMGKSGDIGRISGFYDEIEKLTGLMFEAVHLRGEIAGKEWNGRAKGYQKKIVRRATGTATE
jgi:hypothetical protein